ncbi:MAG TPA: (E)-4-hydroxy-3-methylbut-2-enyl-diphosphate synthase [Bacteroidales bacterium]|nr:(E)-4-hydroxy-3-methylbut-2-enyl-diphosphate synthase [Bacteroidales bacterium]
MSYSDELFYSPNRFRFQTREVFIGDVPLGGNNPIRVQSMTNTDTNDTEATVAQVKQLADAGCEYVRITAQGEREAENLAVIRKSLRSQGYKVPLIADIHFSHRAAEVAASIVEKIRINPGNYADRRQAVRTEYSDNEYKLELERIAERIHPLLKICRENGTAMRIGSNHGSLSGRIMSRYGDTAEGMVESALEFARICDDAGFRNLVISMKSSKVRVMVQATRLLVDKMMAEGMAFPLHLGVTEAGDGEDGIIKSAAGIGALLNDGIGDTIRVSLTGDPLYEIPVAKKIAQHYNLINSPAFIAINHQKPESRNNDNNNRYLFSPFNYRKRETIAAGSIGGNRPVQVLAEKAEVLCIVDENNSAVGPVTSLVQKELNIQDGSSKNIKAEIALQPASDQRPIVLKKQFENLALPDFLIESAIHFGSLLIDGIGEAVWPVVSGIEQEEVTRVAFGILQATRARITRTEFISCPSCGRTLFDIETTLKQIKEKTGHLKGLKIAVMGCIVNGPGEMADADYGYVGAGRGAITLYKRSEVVRKNIPQAEALDTLINLMKESGDWKEPENSSIDRFT